MTRKPLYLMLGLAMLSFTACQNDPLKSEQENKADPSEVTKITSRTDGSDREGDTTEAIIGKSELNMARPEDAARELIAAAKAKDQNRVEALCHPEAKKAVNDNNLCSGDAAKNQELLTKIAATTVDTDIKMDMDRAEVPLRNPDRSLLCTVLMDYNGKRWLVTGISTKK